MLRGRRGFNLVGLIVLVLALVGIGVGLMTLSQQAGRGGHWFHTGQMAHDLADAALKQCVFLLTRANSPTAAQNLPLGPQLKQVYDAIVGTGQAPSGGIELLKFPGGSTVPPTIQSWVDRLKKEWPQMECEVSVKLELRPPEPLWPGSLEGVPVAQGEKRGAIALTARALVKPPSGIPVERRIILEKKYKVINLMPPVLGRFALFTLGSPAAPDQNLVKVRFDSNAPTSGSSTIDGTAYPLMLESKVVGSMIGASPNQLDRNAFIQNINDLKFLDSQGWVYVGGTATTSWILRLAHGWGEAGESPMIPGYIPVPPAGAPQDEAGMKQRIEAAYLSAMQANANTAIAGCGMDFSDPSNGFKMFAHGFANNYESISMSPPNPGDPLDPAVSTGNGPGPAMDFSNEGAGRGETGTLRLFGDALKCSPTLVFGPVKRALMQRARIVVSVVNKGGGCAMPPLGINQTVNVYKWNQQDGPIANQLINAAYQNQQTFDQSGTAVKTEPYFEGLNSILSAGGSGNYGVDGMLQQSNVPGVDKAFTSDLFPAFNGWKSADGIPPQAKTDLANGKLAAPGVFTGDLSNGMKAFNAVMEKKYTYMVEASKFEPFVLDQGKVSVPGIVVIDSQQVLSLKPITEITAGGIIINKGGVTITGDIVRGTPPPPQGGGTAPPPEPLTIVAASGDITIAAGVQNIEAMLIAVDGSVKFPAGDVTITGGVACKAIDAKGIASGGKKKVKYSELVDPNNAQGKQNLKVFYGGDDFVACVGAK